MPGSLRSDLPVGLIEPPALLVAGGPGHKSEPSAVLCHVNVRLTIRSGNRMTS